jgi:hypothetical protein
MMSGRTCNAESAVSSDARREEVRSICRHGCRDKVRHVIGYPRLDSVERGARGLPLGQPAYPQPKGGGDHSLLETPRRPESVYGRARQGSRDRAKATLLELQAPAMRHTFSCNHAWRSHRLTAVFIVAAGALGRWAEANEASQGAERSAYVALFQRVSENMGSPTGREPYGDGALVVVRGRESRPHGEGGQVSNDRQHARGARDA